MKTNNRLALITILPLTLGSFGCATDAGEDASTERGIEDVEGIDGEVTQDLGARPKYTLSTALVRGTYVANASCPATSGCQDLYVVMERGRLVVRFEDGDTYYSADMVADVWASGGNLLFSTKNRLEGRGDCDDPGCGNIEKVTGIIYPVRVGNAWVPGIKTTYQMEYKFPDWDGAPEGYVSETARLTKAR
jgi:hypothetical protein